MFDEFMGVFIRPSARRRAAGAIFLLILVTYPLWRGFFENPSEVAGKFSRNAGIAISAAELENGPANRDVLRIRGAVEQSGWRTAAGTYEENSNGSIWVHGITHGSQSGTGEMQVYEYSQKETSKLIAAATADTQVVRAGDKTVLLVPDDGDAAAKMPALATDLRNALASNE